MIETPPRAPADASRRRIRFVRQAAPGEVVFLSFSDPSPRVAVLASPTAESLAHPRAQGEAVGEGLDVTLLPLTPSPTVAAAEPQAPLAGESAPIYVKARGVELWWRAGQATLMCNAEDTEPLLAALVEFAHYEGELRRIEHEIAQSWTELDQDRALAFDVTPADLRRDDATALRMSRTLQRRQSYARIEPHLHAAAATLPAAGQRLGQELRERTRTEARAEAVDGQLEVFEHIYEMASQRLGEYRAARSGHIMELIIIVLLGMETLLMLFQLVFKR